MVVRCCRWERRLNIWKPQPDITVHELSLCLPALIQTAQHDAGGLNGWLGQRLINALPDAARRHFGADVYKVMPDDYRAAQEEAQQDIEYFLGAKSSDGESVTSMGFRPKTGAPGAGGYVIRVGGKIIGGDIEKGQA